MSVWAAGVAEARYLGTSFIDALLHGDKGAEVKAPEVFAPGGSIGVDLVVFLIFTVVVFVLNWGVRLLVVEPIAGYILKRDELKRTVNERFAAKGRKLHPQVLEYALKEKNAKVEKFAQTAMEQLFYGAFTVIGFFIVSNQTWSWPSSLWWEGFMERVPHPDTGVMYSTHQYMTPAFAAYYILYSARYLQGMITVFLEHKRKDFLEMQIHHLSTVLVVSISYMYGWNRVGVIVMMLLDPADVPLHSAKMFKYVGEERCPENPQKSTYQFVADRLFEVFAVVFFLTRLTLYPYVCWSAHVESKRHFPHGVPEWSCVILLEVLLALQVYWFYLIIKVAIKMSKEGSASDVRSDDEDDAPFESSDKAAVKTAKEARAFVKATMRPASKKD